MNLLSRLNSRTNTDNTGNYHTTSYIYIMCIGVKRRMFQTVDEKNALNSEDGNSTSSSSDSDNDNESNNSKKSKRKGKRLRKMSKINKTKKTDKTKSKQPKKDVNIAATLLNRNNTGIHKHFSHTHTHK